MGNQDRLPAGIHFLYLDWQDDGAYVSSGRVCRKRGVRPAKVNMDIGEAILNTVKEQRRQEFNTSEQLSLGELIAKLEAIKPTYVGYQEKEEPKLVYFDFPEARPTRLMSWRGAYEELALGFTWNEEAEYPTVTELLEDLRGAIGKTFTGYKGGDFVMGKTTPIWVANYGRSDNTAIVEVRDDGYSVILETRHCEY